MSKRKYNLLCVAHPDDETIFFGGLIQNRRNQLPWKIICVTSDGSPARRTQFKKACDLLGVKDFEWWAFPDIYSERLDIQKLVVKLQSLPSPAEIFTHGNLGEYGHPHHQDVSYAVHCAFADHRKLYSVAYNSYPEFEVQLSKKQFSLKAKILTEIYGSETIRFLNVLPTTFSEGFQRLKLSEVKAIYDYLSSDRKLQSSRLSAYDKIKSYLPQLKNLDRPF